MADRDLGIGDLGGGGAAHLAALLQRIHARVHVRKAAAIGVERQFAAGGSVAPGDEGEPASPSGTKSRSSRPMDWQMRKACPWQRTGGVVNHHVVDVIVRDAGSAKALGSVTRPAREEVKSAIWLRLIRQDIPYFFFLAYIIVCLTTYAPKHIAVGMKEGTPSGYIAISKNIHVLYVSKQKKILSVAGDFCQIEKRYLWNEGETEGGLSRCPRFFHI
jgi:hypothetical protein